MSSCLPSPQVDAGAPPGAEALLREEAYLSRRLAAVQQVYSIKYRMDATQSSAAMACYVCCVTILWTILWTTR